MFNYIKIKDYCQEFKANKVNHLVSTAGSGKTKSTIKYIEEYILDNPNKSVLVCTPYIVTKEAFKELFSKHREKVSHNYISLFIDDLKRKYSGDFRDNWDREVRLKYISKIIKQEIAERSLDLGLVILDETDFLFTQATMERKPFSETREKRTEYVIMYVDVLRELFKEFASNEDYLTISISATKLNLSNQYQSYAKNIVTGIKSNVNGRYATIIPIEEEEDKRSYNIDKAHQIINSIVKKNPKAKNIIFSSGKVKRTLSDFPNTITICRRENLTSYYDLLKQVHTSDFDKIDIELVGEDTKIKNGKVVKKMGTVDGNGNTIIETDTDIAKLSDKKFKEYDTTYVGVSSSRCSSLVESYPNGANIFIYTSTINSSVSQIMARFRYAPVNVYIIFTGKFKGLINLQIRLSELDSPLMDKFRFKVDFNPIKSTIGNRVSPKNKLLSLQFHTFMDNLLAVPIKPTSKFFREYQEFAKDFKHSYPMDTFKRHFAKYKNVSKPIVPLKETKTTPKAVKKTLETNCMPQENIEETKVNIDKQLWDNCRNFFMNNKIKKNTLDEYYKNYLAYIEHFLECDLKYERIVFYKAYRYFVETADKNL